MNGSRSRRSTPAKARRTGKPSPSKPRGEVVTDLTRPLPKASFITRNPPHVAWNDEWYSGEPAFSDYPGYHVLLALIASVGHTTLAAAMTLVAYVSMACVVVGLYATVRAATGGRAG